MITDEVKQAVTEWPEAGMMHLFLQHTSAGICINENADASVRKDFDLFYERLAPEDLPGISHDEEGPDDMPAHIKSSLTGVSVHIPIIHGQLGFGTWQGIYLCEFRNRAGKRHIIVTITN